MGNNFSKRVTEDGLLQDQPLSVILLANPDISTAEKTPWNEREYIETRVEVTDPEAYSKLIAQLKDIKKYISVESPGYYAAVEEGADWLREGMIWDSDGCREYVYHEKATPLHAQGYSYCEYINPLAKIFQLVAGIPDYGKYNLKEQQNKYYSLYSLFSIGEAQNYFGIKDHVDMQRYYDILKNSNLSGEDLAKLIQMASPNFGTFACQALDCIEFKPIGEAYKIVQLKEAARELKAKRASMSCSGPKDEEYNEIQRQIIELDTKADKSRQGYRNSKILTLAQDINGRTKR